MMLSELWTVLVDWPWWYWPLLVYGTGWCVDFPNCLELTIAVFRSEPAADHMPPQMVAVLALAFLAIALVVSAFWPMALLKTAVRRRR